MASQASCSPPLVEAWLAVAVCFGGLGAVARLSMGATFGGLVFTMVAGAVLLATVLVVRRESMRFDALIAALRGGDRHPPACGLADQRHLERGPHLRLALRSALVVAQDEPMASRSRAVAAIQVGGWKGKLVRGSVGRLFTTLPGGTTRLLPFITRTEGADLPIPAAVAAGAVGDALDRLDEPITGAVDGVVWLVPPRSDGARAAALLVADGEPVAHLRVSTDLVPGRPSPIVSCGARTGIEWPMILDRWTRDGLEVELSSIIDIGSHGATEIGLNTLLALVDDLQDALAGDGGPRWTTSMHGDLTPWNLRGRGDRLVLFDWENRCFGPRTTATSCDISRPRRTGSSCSRSSLRFAAAALSTPSSGTRIWPSPAGTDRAIRGLPPVGGSGIRPRRSTGWRSWRAEAVDRPCRQSNQAVGRPVNASTRVTPGR